MTAVIVAFMQIDLTSTHVTEPPFARCSHEIIMTVSRYRMKIDFSIEQKKEKN